MRVSYGAHEIDEYRCLEGLRKASNMCRRKSAPSEDDFTYEVVHSPDMSALPILLELHNKILKSGYTPV